MYRDLSIARNLSDDFRESAFAVGDIFGDVSNEGKGSSSSALSLYFEFTPFKLGARLFSVLPV